jgi:triosephosphate isomerase
MRRPIIAANWKMNKTRAEARVFVDALLGLVPADHDCEVVIAPPFTALADLAAALRDRDDIGLAAQNVSAEAEGAFTGEISSAMLAELGCSHGIVGHSERRSLYGETSEWVSRKASALLAAGIVPIVCVGESLQQREAGRTNEVVGAQLEGSLASVAPDQASGLVVAYEPVWAIGTGRTATPEMAQAVHAFVREQLRQLFGDAADAIRIQYGGSVKPDNVAAIMAEPDIDGALVGGASLDPKSFSEIVSETIRIDRRETPAS